jgi:hypothetical protein
MGGEVYVTEIIRYLTKNELCNKEKGDADLYLNNSKRKMYRQYCYNQGWVVKSDNKGRYPMVADYPKRKTDDICFGNTKWRHLMDFQACLEGPVLPHSYSQPMQ